MLILNTNPKDSLLGITIFLKIKDGVTSRGDTQYILVIHQLNQARLFNKITSISITSSSSSSSSCVTHVSLILEFNNLQ